MAKENAKNKSTNALHHPYFQIIADAITWLKERMGSSQPAIAKFVEDKHNKVLPPNFRKLLSVQLKILVKLKTLYKVKKSYNLSSPQTEKPKTALKEKKVAEKMKRPSQVKTPEALKKKAPNKKKYVAVVTTSGGRKVKCFSQVKTPEAMKKKPNLTTAKSKSTPKPSKANKKAWK